MQVSPLTQTPGFSLQDATSGATKDPSQNKFLQELNASSLSNASNEQPEELRTAFRQFVGNTLYGQMLKSMRSTLDKPAYMHGGQTEEIFQQQLDQIMVEDLTEKSASTIADPMFELFNMRRTS